VVARGISVRESNPPTAMQSPDSLDGADVLRPAVAVCIQRPNEVVAEIPPLSVAFASDSGHTPDHLGEMLPALTLPGSLQVRYLRVVIVTM
jgi:hypothetical protein